MCEHTDCNAMAHLLDDVDDAIAQAVSPKNMVAVGQKRYTHKSLR